MSSELLSRFLAKVEKTDGCWLWRAWSTPAGYGMIKIGGRTAQAHRVSYELHVGPIPEGHEIDHLCRNRGCVNPAHLEPVTHTENQRRSAVARGVRAPSPAPRAVPVAQLKRVASDAVAAAYAIRKAGSDV